MARAREPLKDRILRQHAKAGDCWLWTGCRAKDGYGTMTVGRKARRAHRVSFEAFHGPIPEGMWVLHRCDTPLCVNPVHLFLGTAADNAADREMKGRRRVLRGVAHPNTVIPPSERQKIKTLRKGGQSLKQIAERYGVSFQLISDICIGRRNYASEE